MYSSQMFYGAKPALFEKAKVLRQNMTQAELLLWEKLKGSQLGARFKAQHPIDIFIVDFYCHRYKLVVEVDGEIHMAQQEYDKARTEELEKYGLSVIRFTNQEVSDGIESVIDRIKGYLNKK
ncbi:endonuclease domain-containing protein [Dysgonomonas massiliensis]|uniref:endonuclease domain-containing protein n=1 Tax=Dysgonomonas massiliensis TaxID=2040292 RepID=UPI000C790185|nr:endonuclease domain-containing protein [Dysgonomonas massiliensis]